MSQSIAAIHPLPVDGGELAEDQRARHMKTGNGDEERQPRAAEASAEEDTERWDGDARQVRDPASAGSLMYIAKVIYVHMIFRHSMSCDRPMRFKRQVAKAGCRLAVLTCCRWP